MSHVSRISVVSVVKMQALATHRTEKIGLSFSLIVESVLYINCFLRTKTLIRLFDRLFFVSWFEKQNDIQQPAVCILLKGFPS